MPLFRSMQLRTPCLVFPVVPVLVAVVATVSPLQIEISGPTLEKSSFLLLTIFKILWKKWAILKIFAVLILKVHLNTQ
jgi:hypothetical protein